jgi:hypothetical protein
MHLRIPRSLLKENVRPRVDRTISGGGSGLVMEQREHCSPAVPGRWRVYLRRGDDFGVDLLVWSLGGRALQRATKGQHLRRRRLET